MLELSIEYPRYARLHFNSDDYFKVIVDKIDKSFKPSFSEKRLNVPISKLEAEEYMREGFLVGMPCLHFPHHFITVKVLVISFEIPYGSDTADVINHILDLYKTNASRYSVKETTLLNQEITL